MKITIPGLQEIEKRANVLEFNVKRSKHCKSGRHKHGSIFIFNNKYAYCVAID